eukprot:CAMPEP_0184672768 /NCGR_PEP_ID=MMETSP0308-20130426/86296_1 /TAXON_ID=38269 /ORGANISM="Gloeochaete witrockiana, Strain SAG 46.84" /LENGTH=227 /DNA_ID=CAMNT_0027120155 /DNA_START=118 /DNA_END=801 /DNA_ORIENTATION=-
MVFGPIVGYIPQYSTIRSSKNAQGFSLTVSLILLTANVTRLFYWYEKRFDDTLLYQSVVMIIAQMTLVELIVECRRLKVEDPLDRTARDWAANAMQGLLAGTSPFASYVLLIVSQAVALGLLSFLLRGLDIYIEALGYLSLGIESVLTVPQFLRNKRNKSVAGLSGTLIATYFAGDLFKLAFFVHTRSPLPFILCAAFQLSSDVAILYQFHAYGVKSEKMHFSSEGK